eukprot:3652846-Rhodomonas_salina.2
MHFWYTVYWHGGQIAFEFAAPTCAKRKPSAGAVNGNDRLLQQIAVIFKRLGTVQVQNDKPVGVTAGSAPSR